MRKGIYLITNLENNKKYVGKSLDISRRFNEHRMNLNRGTHCNSYLQNAWDKYGEDSFSFSVLEIVKDGENIDKLELEWLTRLDLNNREKGYNLCIPREDYAGVGKHSEETRGRMSRSRFKHIGGYFNLEEYNAWKKDIVEKEANIEKRNYRGDVLVFNKDSGEFIERFKTPSEASKVLKIPRKKIFAVLNKEVVDYKTGKIQRSCKGYKFVYEKEYEPGDEKITGYHIQKKLIKVYNAEGVFQGEFYNARQASEFIGCKWSTLNASIHKGGKLKNGWWAEK